MWFSLASHTMVSCCLCCYSERWDPSSLCTWKFVRVVGQICLSHHELLSATSPAVYYPHRCHVPGTELQPRQGVNIVPYISAGFWYCTVCHCKAASVTPNNLILPPWTQCFRVNVILALPMSSFLLRTAVAALIWCKLIWTNFILKSFSSPSFLNY